MELDLAWLLLALHVVCLLYSHSVNTYWAIEYRGKRPDKIDQLVRDELEIKFVYIKLWLVWGIGNTEMKKGAHDRRAHTEYVNNRSILRCCTTILSFLSHINM